MQFYRRHWYEIGGALFVALAYFMGFWGNHFSQIQVILTYSFMGMLAHQFEEYAIPGGLPGIANIAICGERVAPDRYPLNANQVMISNVFLTYPFYIVPILFPNLIWLGLIQIGQGLSQVIPHGVIMNVKLKSPYNPGMASCLLIQLPLGIYYIWFVQTHPPCDNERLRDRVNRNRPGVAGAVAWTDRDPSRSRIEIPFYRISDVPVRTRKTEENAATREHPR